MASLYRHGGDFCNLHFDEYSVADGKIDFSFGFTFGEDRQLVFEHREGHKVQFALPQRNGDVHAFGEGTNGRWRHGVPPSLECNGPSISINVWGSRGSSLSTQKALPVVRLLQATRSSTCRSP